MKPKRVEIICIDTNVVLRFLMKGGSNLHERAVEIFKRAEGGDIKLYLDEVILAEVIWVLLSFYKMEKQEVGNVMSKLVACKWIVNSRKELMIEALGMWSKKKLSYIDSWFFVMSRDLGLRIESFDLGLMAMN